jgi:hypothetical protein
MLYYWLEDGGRSHELENEEASSIWKTQGNTFSHKHLERKTASLNKWTLVQGDLCWKGEGGKERRRGRKEGKEKKN